jgi:hypothetical protein
MGDAFEQREEGFEKRFAVSEELRFKALARRNKRLGLWAAGLLGRQGEAAEAYADALVAGQVARGDEALAADLAAQFAAAGVEMSAHRIERKIAEAMAEAQASVQAGR